MSKPEGNYMLGNVDNTIQIIESQIDFINSKTDLYDPKFCSQYNDGCSHKLSHIIGEFMPMKKQQDIQDGFKSQCTSINKRLSKLEGCPHSRRKNRSKTFPPLENEFLPTSKISP